MPNRKKIFHVLSIVAWTLVISGVVFVLVSAVQKEQHVICREVIVDIDPSLGYEMIDEKEILSSLWPKANGLFPVGKSTVSFDLFKLEKQVEKNPWVSSANLFFDQQHRMHIVLQQKLALARVFNTDGYSYYLDGNYSLLPVKSNDIISLPVFTNFYFDPIKKSREDSNTIARIVSLSRFIAADSFWMAQVESVNINPDNTFEFVTQVGNHRVMLGLRDDWEHLFKKLNALYSAMMENESWDTYDLVDLQFKDQVVCKRKGFVSDGMNQAFQLDSTNAISLMQDTVTIKSSSVQKQKL
jgi:cell division protein FtsQ